MTDSSGFFREITFRTLIILVLLFTSALQAQWKRSAGIGDRLVFNIRHFDNHLFAATDSGIYRSDDDGLSWFILPAPAAVTQRGAIDFSSCDDKTIYLAAAAGVFVTTDFGLSWRQTNYPNTPSITIFTLDNIILSGTTGGGLYRSTDYGSSWKPVWGDHFYRFAFAPPYLYAGSFDDVIVSTDTGATWKDAELGSFTFCTAVAGERVLAATYYKGLYSTPLNSTKWTRVDNFPVSRVLSDMKVVSDTIYASSGDSIFYCDIRSVDKPWNTISLNGLPYMTGCIEAGNKNLLVGTSIQGGTQGKGIWYLPWRGTTQVKNHYIEKKEFSLEQNYPNPFNSSTRIVYYIPDEEEITLQVYDLPGRLIMNKSYGRMKAGRHEIIFEASGSSFSSGIYFYRINAGTYTAARKFTLLK